MSGGKTMMPMNHHANPAICCDDCKPHAPTRNHYFTGKLLVERDFTDEQWYFREKIRLHHQRLHGTGIVCGLEITEHPNANCQDHLVILHPGSAIDCCGHDILVTEQEIIDITTAPEIQALLQGKDTGTHELEFCLKWRECPIEEVPVLYDECGCDDTQCAPNRILESFALEVRLAKVLPPAHLHAPKFDWDSSINIAQSTAVVLDEANQRVFIVAGSGNATLYQVDTPHLLIETSLPLNRAVLDLALSPDGHTLYVAVPPSGSSISPQLLVFQPDASGGLTRPAVSTVTLSGTDTAIALSVTGDGRLLAVGTATGNLWLLPAGVPTTGTTLNPTSSAARSAASFSSDSNTAWFGSGGTTLVQAALGSGTPVPGTVTITGGSGVSADVVAVVSSGSGTGSLAVLDKAGKALRLVETGGSVIASTALADAPVSILITQGGGYAIVTSAQALQAVDLGALANGASNPTSADFMLSPTIGRSAITSSARRLLVPFSGTSADSGAVAVIDIFDTDCREALRGHPCPACETSDCLVLARVANWKVGFKLEDVQDPPTSPSTDEAAGIARIDNSARTVLASTQAIAQALLCLMDHPNQGLTGAQGSPGTQNVPTLTHISAISWLHGGNMAQTSLGPAPLALGFDGPIQAIDLLQPTALMVQFSHYQLLGNQDSAANAMLCWCALPITIKYASIAPAGPIPSSGWTPLTISTAKGTTCSGAQIEINTDLLQEAYNAAKESKRPFYMRVLFNGDLVRDGSAQLLGIDADHVPPWLPQSPQTGKTGDGVVGGLFESWFELV
jgi:hypothetical protein